jgi:hypothetical protein
MLGKSRFNRRLHAIADLFLIVFQMLGELFKQLNADSVYVIDNFPVPVCDNIRIPRAQLYDDENYRGYIASKRRYFYGVKIHLLVTGSGEPVEVFLTPGATADVGALPQFAFDLPEGSTVYADRAYNYYLIEDLMHEAGIQLLSYCFGVLRLISCVNPGACLVSGAAPS